MSDYTYEELKGKTVAQLREIAAGIDHDAVTGHTQMHKDEVIHAICTALDIDETVRHVVVGINKAQIKARIKALKAERAAAIEAHDGSELKHIRRKIHRLKRKIHKATV